MNMKMNMIFVTADHFHIIYGEWLDEHEKNKMRSAIHPWCENGC